LWEWLDWGGGGSKEGGSWGGEYGGREGAEVMYLTYFSSPLEHNECNNLYFCFRWLIVHFKREFNYQDIMRLWEVGLR
jgi:hypothetical protein